MKDTAYQVENEAQPRSIEDLLDDFLYNEPFKNLDFSLPLSEVDQTISKLRSLFMPETAQPQTFKYQDFSLSEKGTNKTYLNYLKALNTYLQDKQGPAAQSMRDTLGKFLDTATGKLKSGISYNKSVDIAPEMPPIPKHRASDIKILTDQDFARRRVERRMQADEKRPQFIKDMLADGKVHQAQTTAQSKHGKKPPSLVDRIQAAEGFSPAYQRYLQSRSSQETVTPAAEISHAETGSAETERANKKRRRFGFGGLKGAMTRASQKLSESFQQAASATLPKPKLQRAGLALAAIFITSALPSELAVEQNKNTTIPDNAPIIIAQTDAANVCDPATLTAKAHNALSYQERIECGADPLGPGEIIEKPPAKNPIILADIETPTLPDMAYTAPQIPEFTPIKTRSIDVPKESEITDVSFLSAPSETVSLTFNHGALAEVAKEIKPEPVTQTSEIVSVFHGDNLSKLVEADLKEQGLDPRAYGVFGKRFGQYVQANPKLADNPNFIEPGQQFIIPADDAPVANCNWDRIIKQKSGACALAEPETDLSIAALG